MPLLDGVTILDLTQHLSGPFATQILADLGARIVKVEPPAGDPTRRIGPHFAGDMSAYFVSVNRNKESVCLNLKAHGAADALLALVAKVDVVVENFRAGTLDRLGVGYEAMAKANPSIVLCSISGFGQDGPYQGRPAFDMIVQALSGVMSLTGEDGGRPVRSGVPIGDVCAGMYGAIGILAALLGARARGRSSHVDVAMLDTQIAMLSYVAAYYTIGRQVSGPQGRGHLSIPTYRSWTCKDGRDLVTAANTEKQWRSMCRALELDALCEDERFCTNDARLAHRAALYEVLEEAMAARTAEEVLEVLHESDVPAALINSVDTALSDPQVVHRQMVLDLTGDGAMSVVGNPVKVSTPPPALLPPPRLGEHTHAVLAELAGLDAEEIAALEASDAVPVAEPQRLA